MESKILNHIKSKRDLAINERLKVAAELKQKGDAKADKTCENLSKKVSLYTKLIKEIESIYPERGVTQESYNILMLKNLIQHNTLYIIVEDESKEF